MGYYIGALYIIYIAVSIFSGKEMRATVLLRTFDLPLLAFRCFLFHLVCFFQLSIRGAEKRRERSRMKNIEERKEKKKVHYIFIISYNEEDSFVLCAANQNDCKPQNGIYIYV